MKQIYLPPDARVLMESTRALGYSLESAIADLLDNSVAVESKNINIQFRPFDNPYLYILDDGHGMSPKDITNSMRYGSHDPNLSRSAKDLGRFGLGLKTASLSQCRCLTVVTKKDGVISGRQWNLDVVKDWNLLELDDKHLEELPGYKELIIMENGTLVVWQKLDRLLNGVSSPETLLGQKMTDVRNHISLVFHRYLSGEPGLNKVLMSINNVPVSPVDPFLVGKSEQIMDIEPIYINKQKISVTPYVLPHISRLSKNELDGLGGEEGLRRKQGFYIYRSKRLLVWGTWFRLLRQDELYKLARVKIDIPNSLDHQWTLDIRKSTAIPPEAVKNCLKVIVKTIADRSKRTYTFRGRKETSEDINHIWDRVKTRNGIKYTINRKHPFADTIRNKLGKENQVFLDQIFKLIETGLPLHALYIDLTGDEHFDSDSFSDSEIYQQAKDILNIAIGNKEMLEEIFIQLYKTEPFSLAPKVLERLKMEVLVSE
jgi:hypothetical protein